MLANLNNVLGSRYLKRLRSQAVKLQQEILYAQQTIDEWVTCQKNWMYLESIFVSPDIKKRLAYESKLFDTVDKWFKAKMRATNSQKAINKTFI